MVLKQKTATKYCCVFVKIMVFALMFYKSLVSVLMHNNIIFLFQISYKQEQEQGEYNYPATLTPGYQSQRKLDPLKDVSPLKLVQTPIYLRSPTQF